jgi:hypothetical protein
MIRSISYALLIACLWFAVSPAPASGAATPFMLRLVGQDQIIRDIADGSTINLASGSVKTPVTAALTITYVGFSPLAATSAVLGPVTLTGLNGLADFSITGMPDAPVTLLPNQSVTVNFTYKPTTSYRMSALATFSYQESGATAPSQFIFNLAGSAADFGFSYVLQPSGNASVLTPGGTVNFAQTSTTGSSSAVVILSNKGSATGTVNTIAASGTAFQLSGVPLAGTTVDPGRDVRFTIAFTPQQVSASTGSLSIGLADKTVSFNLQGTGQGPAFAYEVVQGSTVTPALPNGAIRLPDMQAASQTTFIVRVRNAGNMDGTVSAISILGDGFQLAGLPFLPLTLPVGGSTSFTVNYSPVLAGPVSGRLRVGNDNFDFAGTVLGPSLAYSYTSGGNTVNVQDGATLMLTTAAVGRTSTAKFTVTNSGTAAATVNTVAVGAAAVFTILDLPALPLTIAAGKSVTLTIQFAPAALGASTASLSLDAHSFTLSGSGAQPDAIPSYTFDAPSGPQDPMLQPGVGLTLASSYPLALSGTLTLTFNSEVFTNDPAVQFATGSRSVAFTIPANSTKAVFPNGSNQIKLQTGTVAGTITITPAFATVTGGLDLTPAVPPVLNLTVPQSAPRLLGVEVSQKTANGFTLLVKGLATSRTLTAMDFQFAATGGENVATTKLTVNVEPNFVAWYQGQTSAQYGSLFTATVPFTLQGDVKSVMNVVDTIQSVSVTLTNKLGTSAAQSVALR